MSKRLGPQIGKGIKGKKVSASMAKGLLSLCVRGLRSLCGKGL